MENNLTQLLSSIKEFRSSFEQKWKKTDQKLERLDSMQKENSQRSQATQRKLDSMQKENSQNITQFSTEIKQAKLESQELRVEYQQSRLKVEKDYKQTNHNILAQTSKYFSKIFKKFQDVGQKLDYLKKSYQRSQESQKKNNDLHMKKFEEINKKIEQSNKKTKEKFEASDKMLKQLSTNTSQNNMSIAQISNKLGENGKKLNTIKDNIDKLSNQINQKFANQETSINENIQNGFKDLRKEMNAQSQEMNRSFATYDGLLRRIENKLEEARSSSKNQISLLQQVLQQAQNTSDKRMDQLQYPLKKKFQKDHINKTKRTLELFAKSYYSYKLTRSKILNQLKMIDNKINLSSESTKSFLELNSNQLQEFISGRGQLVDKLVNTVKSIQRSLEYSRQRQKKFEQKEKELGSTVKQIKTRIGSIQKYQETAQNTKNNLSGKIQSLKYSAHKELRDFQDQINAEIAQKELKRNANHSQLQHQVKNVSTSVDQLKTLIQKIQEAMKNQGRLQERMRAIQRLVKLEKQKM